MKIACLQPEVLPTRSQCYNEIERLLKELLEKAGTCRLISLPERWVPFLNDIHENIQEERGKDYQFIKSLAREYSVNFVSGAIWEKRSNLEKPIITSYYISENGEEIGRQDKIHLYSYEREHFLPGNVLNLFNLDNFQFAILICFDMAFFETPRLATENGADFLVSPTQIREEGLHNWNIYLQARALENKIPVIACNVVGSFFKRKFLGKSKIISYQKGPITPSILNIKEGPIGTGFIFDDVDLKFPLRLRKIRLAEKVEKTNIKVIKNP